jgi:hypothetical protein
MPASGLPGRVVALLTGKGRSEMNTGPKTEMLYRLAIGIALLLLGVLAEMSIGAKVVVFLIAALAFVEAYLNVPGKNPYSRRTLK